MQAVLPLDMSLLAIGWNKTLHAGLTGFRSQLGAKWAMASSMRFLFDKNNCSESVGQNIPKFSILWSIVKLTICVFVRCQWFWSYPEALGDFTTSRAQATTCRACLPGMHSVPLIDGEGRTYICQPCPEGTHQLAAGAVVCDPCPLGTSKAEVSTAECQPCASGFYQDERGKAGCSRPTFPNHFVFSSQLIWIVSCILDLDFVCSGTYMGPPNRGRKHASVVRMALRLCFLGWGKSLVVAAQKEPLMSRPIRRQQPIAWVAVKGFFALTCLPQKIWCPEATRTAKDISPRFSKDAGWWFLKPFWFLGCCKVPICHYTIIVERLNRANQDTSAQSRTPWLCSSVEVTSNVLAGCRELVVEALKGFLVVSAQLTHFGLTTHALPVGAGLRLAGFWRWSCSPAVWWWVTIYSIVTFQRDHQQSKVPLAS